MKNYYAETTIRIDEEEAENGAPAVTLIMRPLKVKEIPALLRIEARATSGEGEATLTGFADLIDLVAATVTGGDIKALPAEALDGIIKAFDELNFPGGMKKKGKQKPFEEREFARMIELLISQGHNLSEIEEYTLPRFRLFVDLAIERLSGKAKKEVDPMEALAALGIPMRQ